METATMLFAKSLQRTVSVNETLSALLNKDGLSSIILFGGALDLYVMAFRRFLTVSIQFGEEN